MKNYIEKNNFYTQLLKLELFDNYAAVLDWLFDDDKFDSSRGWNGGYISSYTKKWKKQLGFCDENNIMEIKNPRLFFNNKTKKRLYSQRICMNSTNSISKDLVRHIRNGIAHGNAEIKNISSRGVVLTVIDYKKDGDIIEDQTAFICIKLDDLHLIKDIYDEVNKSKNNNKISGRKTNKHR